MKFLIVLLINDSIKEGSFPFSLSPVTILSDGQESSYLGCDSSVLGEDEGL